MSIDAFAPWHGVKPSEMLSFLRSQGFDCKPVQGPRRGTQVRLSGAEQQEFHKRFISFRRLGVIAKMGWQDLRMLLEAEGICPVDRSERIYRRSEVIQILS